MMGEVSREEGILRFKFQVQGFRSHKFHHTFPVYPFSHLPLYPLSPNVPDIAFFAGGQ